MCSAPDVTYCEGLFAFGAILASAPAAVQSFEQACGIERLGRLDHPHGTFASEQGTEGIAAGRHSGHLHVPFE